ncbi:hypothetical protein niasHT_019582 [Heterodera trifolii]|uniref:Uncharacterized protein n=1 Tax=Heterodera trifolii TaxID=157864 RepID=A0ABD2L7Y3_9BILA
MDNWRGGEKVANAAKGNQTNWHSVARATPRQNAQNYILCVRCASHPAPPPPPAAAAVGGGLAVASQSPHLRAKNDKLAPAPVEKWFRLENTAPPTDFSVLAKDAESDQCSENRSNVSPKRHKGKKGQMICKVNGQPISGNEQCQDELQQQCVQFNDQRQTDVTIRTESILKALMELNGHRFCHFAGEQQMPYVFVLIKLNLFIFN